MRHEQQVFVAAFAQEGNTVLTGSGVPLTTRSSTSDSYWEEGGQVRLWDSQSGRPLCGPLRLEAPIKAMAFSPDGRMFVTGTWRGNVCLWSVALAKPLGLELSGNAFDELCFSQDGESVVGAEQSSHVWMWTVLCRLVGRNDQVTRWVQVTTGLYLDESGTVGPLREPAWHAQFDQLQKGRRACRSVH